MRWKQFFTPVKSIDAAEARRLMEAHTVDEITLLDVRQPSEYQRAHLPGARLIPMPDLGGRLDEIDPDRPLIVY